MNGKRPGGGFVCDGACVKASRGNTAKPNLAFGHKAIGHDVAENGAIVKPELYGRSIRPPSHFVKG